MELFRLFDSEGEGFIPVLRFREILAEVDEDFTETELDDIIAEVRKFHLIYQNQPISSTVSPVSLEFPCID